MNLKKLHERAKFIHDQNDKNNVDKTTLYNIMEMIDKQNKEIDDLRLTVEKLQQKIDMLNRQFFYTINKKNRNSMYINNTIETEKK